MSEQKYKTRTPVQKRGKETKLKIIEAAEVLFSEKGYHKTNAQEIAARAGVATGSFYGYFNNKKEVLIEVIKDFYADVSEKVLNTYQAQLHDHDNSTDNYREGRKLVHFMLHALYSAHEINPTLHRELLAMIMLDGEIEKANREEEQKVIASMVSLLHAYKEHIRVKDIEAAALLLYRVGEEVVHRIRIVGADVDGTRMLTELEDMICRYLLKPE